LDFDLFWLVLGGILVMAFAGLAGVLGYKIGTRRKRRTLAESQRKASLRLRPEVTAWVDRHQDAASLIIQNVGGVDALEVDFQARWEIGGQEVEALVENEKYRLPLPVLPVGNRETFDLKFSGARSPQLFLSLSWKNRAGRVEKRSLALQS